MGYKIVSGNRGNVEIEVKELTEKGWKCQGGISMVSVRSHTHDEGVIYSQAMISSICVLSHNK